MAAHDGWRDASVNFKIVRASGITMRPGAESVGGGPSQTMDPEVGGEELVLALSRLSSQVQQRAWKKRQASFPFPFAEAAKEEDRRRSQVS